MSIQNKSFKSAEDLHVSGHLLGAIYLASLAESIVEHGSANDDLEVAIKNANDLFQTKHTSFSRITPTGKFFKHSTFNPLHVLKKMQTENIATPASENNAAIPVLPFVNAQQASNAKLLAYRNTPNYFYKLLDVFNEESHQISILEALTMLEINPDTEISENIITQQYKRLSLKYHPDKNNDTEESKEAFQKLDVSKTYLIAHYASINAFSSLKVNEEYLKRLYKRQSARYALYYNVSILEALTELSLNPLSVPSKSEIRMAYAKRVFRDFNDTPEIDMLRDLLIAYQQYLENDDYPAD